MAGSIAQVNITDSIWTRVHLAAERCSRFWPFRVDKWHLVLVGCQNVPGAESPACVQKQSCEGLKTTHAFWMDGYNGLHRAVWTNTA